MSETHRREASRPAGLSHSPLPQWHLTPSLTIRHSHQAREKHDNQSPLTEFSMLYPGLRASPQCSVPVPTTPLVFKPGLVAYSDSRASALSNSVKKSDPLVRSYQAGLSYLYRFSTFANTRWIFVLHIRPLFVSGCVRPSGSTQVCHHLFTYLRMHLYRYSPSYFTDSLIKILLSLAFTLTKKRILAKSAIYLKDEDSISVGENDYPFFTYIFMSL